MMNLALCLQVLYLEQYKPTTNDIFSMSYGAKPLNAAPHLSHDFQCFLPSTKRLRIDNIPPNADDLELSMSNGRITDSTVNANSSSFENLLNRTGRIQPLLLNRR